VRRFRWWFVLGVIVVSLGVSLLPSGNDVARTPEERVTHLASEIRCPTCAGLSVEQSDAALAQSSKEEIRSRVGQGQSDEQIKAYFVSRYGPTALMSPEKTGINRLPWLLPVVLVLILTGTLVGVTRRWRAQGSVVSSSPTAEDRLLVEAALRART
jgi:cytochrome c-type biogenesis protein CcmH